MQRQQFDHTLTLKMTSQMRQDIDNGLILVQDTVIRSRSEFLRVACQFALDSLAGDCGDEPVTVEERKNRVLAGGDELGTDGSEQVRAPAMPRDD